MNDKLMVDLAGDMDHMGFDENEMMRGGSGMDETLFKNAEPALIEENDKDRSADKMDISNEDLGGGFGGVYGQLASSF